MAFNPDKPGEGFVNAANKFFGRREGQSLGDFAKEIKALSPQDVADLNSGIQNGTLTY